jgi:hypothetical protein
MTEKTLKARVLLVGSGKPEEDRGQMCIMICDIMTDEGPNRQPTGRLYAFFDHKQQAGSVEKIIDHKGQEASGPVAAIPDWEETKTPTVWINRSESPPA